MACRRCRNWDNAPCGPRRTLRRVTRVSLWPSCCWHSLVGFTQYTVVAALAFLIARLIHMPAYIIGIPILRIFSWAMGFVAMVYLLIVALAALV